MTVTNMAFGRFLRPNRRPYTLGPTEDANLVGMKLYGQGPFHREFKSATKIRKKTHFVIRSGDVIYNKLFAWKGTFGVVPPDLDGMFVSDKFPTYEHDPSVVDLDFLRWLFRFPGLWEQARRMSVGSAAISKLTLNPPRFLQLRAPIPTSLDHQRAIVVRLERALGDTSEAVRLRRSTIDNARSFVTSQLAHWTRDWTVRGALEDIFASKPRNGWSARCDNAEGGTPVLSLGAVTGFAYDSTQFKMTSLPTTPEAHYWLNTGDLLITRSNTPDLVGHAAIYSGLPHPCIYPDLMMRLDVDPRRATPRFVWYWLQTPLCRSFIAAKARGTSPTMRKISQKTVCQIPFPTGMSLEEQSAFVDRIEKVRRATEELLCAQLKSAPYLEDFLPSIVSRTFATLFQATNTETSSTPASSAGTTLGRSY